MDMIATIRRVSGNSFEKTEGLYTRTSAPRNFATFCFAQKPGECDDYRIVHE